MLRSLGQLFDFDIAASDGEIGHVHDFYFDDRLWAVRYLVVDTGKWIFGRKVLIAPECASAPNAERRDLPVMLTRDQVKSSPDVKCDLPVSRQDETRIRDYYNWSRYWEFFSPVGTAGGFIVPPLENQRRPGPEAHEMNRSDPDLHSLREVRGYALVAEGESCGEVADLLADDDWHVPYLVVQRDNDGRHAVIPAGRVEDIETGDKRVLLSISRSAVEAAPACDPAAPIGPDREALFMEHYGLSRADPPRRPVSSRV